MANLVLASLKEVKSGSQMWHVYRTENGNKSDEFYFAQAIKALRFAFILRKRHGAIIPKAIYGKLYAAYQAEKAAAPTAAPTAEAVEQAKYFATYKEMKAKHPDALLLFRVGELYRTFGDDSEAMNAAIGRDKFAAAELDSWLPALVRKGHRVAICDEENLKK